MSANPGAEAGRAGQGGLSCGRGLHGKQDGKMRLLTRSALAANKGLGVLSSESAALAWAGRHPGLQEQRVTLIGPCHWLGAESSGLKECFAADRIDRGWPAASDVHGTYMLRSGLVSGRVVATLETARCCDFAQSGGGVVHILLRPVRALAYLLAASQRICVRNLPAFVPGCRPNWHLGDGWWQRSAGESQCQSCPAAPQHFTLLPAAPRLCPSRLQEHFAAAACRPLRARHCCCSVATVGILYRQPRPLIQ